MRIVIDRETEDIILVDHVDPINHLEITEVNFKIIEAKFTLMEIFLKLCEFNRRN